MNYKLNCKEIDKIKNNVEKIMGSELSWEIKYHLIFSNDIARKVNFEYLDPDSSYEEDVLAWYKAFSEHYEIQNKINLLNLEY